MNSGILDKSWCYLMGAMENADDAGVSWRRQFIQACRLRKLDIIFLDPTNKIAGLVQEVDEHSRIIELKAKAKWDELSALMKRIVREDHRAVDNSDFVVFYLDPAVPTCGSYFEFQSAMTEKKPYFIIAPRGKASIPAWIFGICDHRFIFESVDDVADMLLGLHNGSIPLSDRWVLFHKHIEKRYL